MDLDENPELVDDKTGSEITEFNYFENCDLKKIFIFY